MFTLEEKRKAIETLIKFDTGFTDTVAKLDYLDRAALYNWWHKYEEFSEVRSSRLTRKSKSTLETKRKAVAYYLKHGKHLAKTRRALGCPGSDELLRELIDELVSGERRIRAPHGALSTPEKIEIR